MRIRRRDIAVRRGRCSFGGPLIRLRRGRRGSGRRLCGRGARMRGLVLLCCFFLSAHRITLSKLKVVDVLGSLVA